MPVRRLPMTIALIALLTCAALAADPNAPIRIKGYQGTIRVACVGDSITAGVGAASGESYPDQLGKMLGKRWEVRNFGVSGSTLLSHGDLPYQKQAAFQAALQYQPQVVIIMLGTNDTKPQNWKLKGEFTADYKDLLGQFAKLPSKPQIFLCRPVPVPGQGNYGINEAGVLEEAPLIDKIARQMQAGVIDMYAALKDHPEMLPDRVHLRQSTDFLVQTSRAITRCHFMGYRTFATPLLADLLEAVEYPATAGSQDHYQPTRVGGDSPHGPRRLRGAVSYSLQPLQRAPNIQPAKAADPGGGQPTQYIYIYVRSGDYQIVDTDPAKTASQAD